MKTKKKPFAWSYSVLTAYETCPLKRKFQLDKAPKPFNKYMSRGIEIHQEGEDYLNGKLKRVPQSYQKFSDQLKALKKNKAQAEQELAFTREWKLTEWFGDKTWFRCKLDANHKQETIQGAFLLRVIDFKTGRPKEYLEQERVNVMAALLGEPRAKAATMEFWFLDQGVCIPKKPRMYIRNNMLKGAMKEFEIRAARMEAEKKFPPKIGSHCSYCDYSKRKGGPCPHN